MFFIFCVLSMVFIGDNQLFPDSLFTIKTKIMKVKEFPQTYYTSIKY